MKHPVVVAQRFDERVAVILVDVWPLGARFTAQGQDALHALFQANLPDGDFRHEQIGPELAEALVDTRKLRHVAGRAGSIARSHIEPAEGAP
jgi:hypothetical protein